MFGDAIAAHNRVVQGKMRGQVGNDQKAFVLRLLDGIEDTSIESCLRDVKDTSSNRGRETDGPFDQTHFCLDDPHLETTNDLSIEIIPNTLGLEVGEVGLETDEETRLFRGFDDAVVDDRRA